jgi:hypothetical protein
MDKLQLPEIKNAIDLLEEASGGMVLVDFKQTYFAIDNGEVYWVEDNEMYSAEIHHYQQITEDYFFFEGDTDQGYYMSYFFDKSFELTIEDFYKRFGDLG